VVRGATLLRSECGDDRGPATLDPPNERVTAVSLRDDEASLPQQPEVIRHGRGCDASARRELPHGPGALPEPAEHPEPGRVSGAAGQGDEGRVDHPTEH
jgi:hypothetical protein